MDNFLIMSGDKQPGHVQYGQCMCNARAQTCAGHVHEYHRVLQMLQSEILQEHPRLLTPRFAEWMAAVSSLFFC